MKRNATAIWYGSGQNGKGKLSTESEALKEAQYSYKTRFEDGVGTNPEELIAAAHAGCFTMKLAFNIDSAGFEAESLETTCSIELKDGVITSSYLDVRAKIPNIQKNKLDELVTNAEKNCPISKVLNTNIFVDVHLEN
ncbi:OsmC family peroxiredoxin [Olivibacter domesticus]|uniref:Osmotically inducible protein OsmC n=1 Tax=Olivibacter domesticus TaxID=407022 RepID=A0A1H7XS90_OLID1|nr:OsmC family peroxiredoxin [Olivibacter domesticus]SEM36802.1 osmotically inducible protein OsmC [Olivibacter domesticus]